MGIFSSKRSKAEEKGYRRIVARKTTLAARQAYADEAVKVAAEKARAKARRKSFGEIISERVRGGVERRISGTPRPSSVRRVVRRRTPVRRVVRRRTPVRRVVRRRIATPIQPRAPQTLNEAIYG